MVLIDDEAQGDSCFSPFGDSANVDEDRSTVCAKRTIGSETCWTHPMVLLGHEAQVET